MMQAVVTIAAAFLYLVKYPLGIFLDASYVIGAWMSSVSLLQHCHNTDWHWLCSGPCGGVCCLGHLKNICDDDDDDEVICLQ